MKISVSGRQFSFPRSCACCGAYPLTSLRVSGAEQNRRSRTQGWVWEVPYCIACKKHIRVTEVVQVGFLLAGAGSTLASFLAGQTSGWEKGMGLLALLSAAVGAVGWCSYRALQRLRTINCNHLTRSVTYLGAAGVCHSFRIRSRFYATEFVRANHRKLVNASPQVVSILRSTGVGDHQVPRRIIKKRSYGER